MPPIDNDFSRSTIKFVRIGESTTPADREASSDRQGAADDTRIIAHQPYPPALRTMLALVCPCPEVFI